jgi:hypothetical protein
VNLYFHRGHRRIRTCPQGCRVITGSAADRECRERHGEPEKRPTRAAARTDRRKRGQDQEAGNG